MEKEFREELMEYNSILREATKEIKKEGESNDYLKAYTRRNTLERIQKRVRDQKNVTERAGERDELLDKRLEEEHATILAY
jgi:hypothetical protein